MSKNHKISNLFSQAFATNDFTKRAKIKEFKCKKQKDCLVDLTKEATYTPYLGDEDTNIMIIAEAPSVVGGKGAYIGGKFKDIESDSRSPIHLIKEFCEKHFNTIPYFTDLIKCGVAKQRDKEVLKVRCEYCIEHFLLKEIEIMRPERILCIGKTSYDFMMKYKNKGKISEDMKVFNLLHYSRQAMLPLSDRDKFDIVWKVQAGITSKEDVSKISLDRLSYFKNNKN